MIERKTKPSADGFLPREVIELDYSGEMDFSSNDRTIFAYDLGAASKRKDNREMIERERRKLMSTDLRENRKSRNRVKS